MMEGRRAWACLAHWKKVLFPARGKTRDGLPGRHSLRFMPLSSPRATCQPSLTTFLYLAALAFTPPPYVCSRRQDFDVRPACHFARSCTHLPAATYLSRGLPSDATNSIPSVTRCISSRTNILIARRRNNVCALPIYMLWTWMNAAHVSLA